MENITGSDKTDTIKELKNKVNKMQQFMKYLRDTKTKVEQTK